MPPRKRRKTDTRASRPRPASPRVSNLKLQRWMELVAALLGHRSGLTFEALRRHVPAYAAAKEGASLARMFERDKNDLREYGIPIEVVGDPEDDEPPRYRVDPREMYLPYLSLLSAARPPAPAKVPKEGYRALPSLALEPDELAAVLRGARLAASLGDPALSADVEGAVRKLTFDLPAGIDLPGDADADAPPPRAVHSQALRTLGEALLRRKRVTFTYHTMGSDTVATRTVEPYGLFLSGGHWYLAGRDVERDALRNFRVSRMADVSANERKMQSTDYEVPADFHLATHARSREAWEMGDGDAEEMTLEFRGESGPTRAAARLGAPVPGAPRHRAFQVRRLDSFARWVLSFGGEVAPVSPPRLVEEVHALAEHTRALYAGTGA
ncbi:MAG TPA: WYL domain-containing protein [Gemmatimonadaceae bacterium]|nr:WYL domain-containing protein [Gemmatimonadaceae bacterium]